MLPETEIVPLVLLRAPFKFVLNIVFIAPVLKSSGVMTSFLFKSIMVIFCPLGAHKQYHTHRSHNGGQGSGLDKGQKKIGGFQVGQPQDMASLFDGERAYGRYVHRPPPTPQNRV